MADSSFDDILKKITENPELMTKISQIAKSTDGESLADKLPSVISVISNAIDNNGDKSEKNDTPPDKNDVTSEKAISDFALPVAKLQEKITKNSKLLIALKPYLSKERCDIVDSIIKMAQVADLMKLIK